MVRLSSLIQLSLAAALGAAQAATFCAWDWQCGGRCNDNWRCENAANGVRCLMHGDCKSKNCGWSFKCLPKPAPKPKPTPKPTNAPPDNITCSARTVGRYAMNKCQERCVCEKVGSEFKVVCYRERKEVTCMSKKDRMAFFKAFREVSKEGHSHYPQMRELVKAHADNFREAIHSWHHVNTAQWFLPWHRWYIHTLEDMLREATGDCSITVPWFDWSQKADDWWTSEPFLSGEDWLGSNGEGQCMRDGAFKDFVPAFTVREDQCLVRRFTRTGLTTIAGIAALIWGNDYSDMNYALEFGPHGLFHVRAGGLMASGSSPGDALFWMHHAFIDQIWDRWQRSSPARAAAYDDYDKDLELIFSDMRWSKVARRVSDHFSLKDSGVMYVSSGSGLDNEALPKCQQVEIDNELFNWDDIVDALFKASADDLQHIPQDPLRIVKLEELERFFNNQFEENADAGRSVASDAAPVAARQVDGADWKARFKALERKTQAVQKKMDLAQGIDHSLPLVEMNTAALCVGGSCGAPAPDLAFEKHMAEKAQREWGTKDKPGSGFSIRDAVGRLKVQPWAAGTEAGKRVLAEAVLAPAVSGDASVNVAVVGAALVGVAAALAALGRIATSKRSTVEPFGEDFA